MIDPVFQAIREMHKPAPNVHKALVWVYPEGRSELITPEWLCEECQCDSSYCEKPEVAWPCRTILALPEVFHALDYEPLDPMAAHMLDFEIGEAFHALKALILAKADHEISRVNQALRDAGIANPQNSAGVRDLAMIVKTYPGAIADAMREELEDEGKRHGLTNGVGSPFYRGMEFMIQFVENYGNEE